MFWVFFLNKEIPGSGEKKFHVKNKSAKIKIKNNESII